MLFSSAAMAVGTAGSAAADSSRALQVKSSADVVVDGVHQRVFVSDPAGGKVVATTYGGTVVGTVASLPGVTDLELSADSGTLYAASPGADAIVAIDTTTVKEAARYATGANTDPKYLALAGGKLWFGYTSDIGSLDLSGAEPVITLAQDTQNTWSGAAPMLDAAGGVLVAGMPVQSPAELAVYDVTSGTATRTAHATVDGGNMGDLAVTPDGKQVVVASAAPYHHAVYKTSDLTADGAYASDAYPNAVDIAPGGAVAAGISGSYEPDVYVYKPGATTAVRTYDFPNTGQSSGSDLLQSASLAWAPDGSRLFAVSSNSEGVYSLRVLDDPTKAATNISVSAPAKATRAKKLTVTGKVRATVPLPAGAQLAVKRTDVESPGGRSLASVTVKADGSYSFTDTPPAGGKVTYTVSFAGDAAHAAGSGKDTVDVSRTATSLTLNNNGKVYSYGSDVKFTARLGKTYKNRTVEIWADPYGGDKPNKLVKKGTVSRGGYLSVTLDLKRDTKVTAKFAGDARSASKSVSSVAGARVRVSTSVSGHYKTKSAWGQKYHYVRKSKDPSFTTTMTYYKGRKQRLQIEAYYQGAWRDAGWEYFELGTSGKSEVTLTGTPTTNVRFRLRSSYIDRSSGDNVNSTTHGPWKYFIFTS